METLIEEGELEESTPEEAFAVLGHTTRLTTLRVLWEADEPQSFASLRRAVAPDDTGNFSYHLGKLTSHFVRKADEGYVLRYAGEQVIRAVLSGTITSDPVVAPGGTDDRCPFCESALEMSYDREVITVQCTGCGGVIGGGLPAGTCMQYEFPPAGLVGRSRGTAVDAAHVLYDSKIAPMIKGVCPECAGSVGWDHDVCDGHERGDSGLCPRCETRYEVWSTAECDHCQYTRRFPPWYAALNHPAAIAFLYDHGIDEKVPFRKITWDNARYVRDISVTAVDADPARFRVTILVEGDRLVLSMTAGFDVTAVDSDDEN